MKKSYNIESLNPSAVTEEWMWRDKNGEYHYVEEMSTRHLFYTIRMIWNHVVPTKLRFKPYIHHSFNNKIYTNAYFSEAIFRMMKEIVTRQDILPEWQKVLDMMGIIIKSRSDAIAQSKGGICL